MARRIDEGDRPAVPLDAIGADVLGDAAFFVRGHVDADDAVQQRRLAVVHVAEERDDRRARLELRRVVRRFERLDHLLLQVHRVVEGDLDAQLHRQQLGHFGVERGGDVAHRPQFEQFGQDVAGGHAEGLGETPHRAGQLDADVFAPRRRGVGAGPADVGALPRR